YSATKHIDGQGRVVGGAILGTEEFINGPIAEFVQATGPTLSAFNGWVLLKGLETLPLRIRAQSAASLDLATWLENHPAIAQVRYPFLPSHPQYDLAMRSEEHTSELQSRFDLVCRLLLEKKNN